MIDPTTYDRILEKLSYVEDPELGINIVDLGLIYDIRLEENQLEIDMTLTYVGCPLTEVIYEDVSAALEEFKYEISINWIWIPAWQPSQITEAGVEQLRALGMNL
jgi:metal-sulfur cluster biosynthetic enzyme